MTENSIQHGRLPVEEMNKRAKSVLDLIDMMENAFDLAKDEQRQESYYIMAITAGLTDMERHSWIAGHRVGVELGREEARNEQSVRNVNLDLRMKDMRSNFYKVLAKFEAQLSKDISDELYGMLKDLIVELELINIQIVTPTTTSDSLSTDKIACKG